MIKNNLGPLLAVLILFLILNAFFIVGRNFFEKWNTDQSVLVGGNLVLFLATLSSYFLATRSLRSTNPHASVRAMYGSFHDQIIHLHTRGHLFTSSGEKNVNKPALFTCMGIYVVYSILEVSVTHETDEEKKECLRKKRLFLILQQYLPPDTYDWSGLLSQQ